MKKYRFLATGLLAALGLIAVSANAEKSALEKTYAEELTIGAVFFPLIRALETSTGDDASLLQNAVERGYLTAAEVAGAKDRDVLAPSYFRDQCKVYSGGNYVWARRPKENSGAQSGSEHPFISVPSPFEALPVTAEAQAELGTPPTPGERIKCMIAYQSVVERAVNLLGRAETARIVRYDLGQKMTYALEDLEFRAARAFWLALIDPRAKRDSGFWISRLLDGEQQCRVPTPTGIKTGKTEFACGPFMMDQEKLVFVEGGRIFSADEVHGMRIKFAETVKPAPK